ncbi:MAG TPA: SDR family oxidoreductase [Leptospiraceae bacterium]|nr:SDR family oxidoreductase [Leptospiraceae bacterium]HMW06448.1 SDR family oxidoreductase [Leptospiraceae bacterium]HMX31536.1 SDR family oxidoreductase [Leptospiraceae bacterium]HMY31925.1 SDR family oxidoreductase [Leptospiraceae bacterium]HMZ63210.1 SDR family oxidoreductase [Leptospiraceae bacterium]
MSKTFIVTGASGGIGIQIVKKLLEEGAIVVATDIDLKSLEELKTEFSNYKEKLLTEILDVRKPELWEKVISLAKSQSAPFYCLINSAGVLMPGYIINTTPKDIDFHIDINAKGIMLGSQLAAKYFVERKAGHIINIASLAGLSPVPGIALYSASKFAVRGFTLALAMELEKYNVNVTCICPDAVTTPMLDLQKDYEEAALTFSGSKPLSAEEVADVVLDTIGSKKMEVTIGYSRGFQAKLAGMFPALASKIVNVMRLKGIENQEKFKRDLE